MTVDLSGKVAVVTGGGGVLCSVMAEALATAGASVALLDLNVNAAEKIAVKIRNSGGKAMAVECNVLDKASLEAAATCVESALGVCDILINGAGGNNAGGTTGMEFLEQADLTAETGGGRNFFELDGDGVSFVFDLNFKGTFLTVQTFARKMAERNNGCIINISSMNAFTPLTKIPAYSAAKAAVSNFTRWLAVHFAHVNIRVNAIAPGFFLTEQNRTLLTRPDGTLTERGEKILAHTPVGRFGEPEDLTGILLFLCDNKASGFVNGSVIAVDGAFSAYSGV